MEQFLKPKF